MARFFTVKPVSDKLALLQPNVCLKDAARPGCPATANRLATCSIDLKDCLMDPVKIAHAVSAEEAGKTVLACLRQLVPTGSWSQLRGWIERGHVSINHLPSLDVARRLAVGELLSVTPRPGGPAKLESIEIAYGDPKLVIAVKPNGVQTLRAPSEKHWSPQRRALHPALDEMLGRQIRGSTGPRIKLRSVHRLDRDASGLVVFARDSETQQNLISQFADHSASRVYHALVRGRMESQTIESHIGRAEKGKRRSEVEAGQGQLAITHFRFLEEIGETSLVECRLETGRTNQIRIQAAEAGHPLVGDLKYGPVEEAGPFVGSRLMLHAVALELTHPTIIDGASPRRIVTTSAVPADFLAVIKRLRTT